MSDNNTIEVRESMLDRTGYSDWDNVPVSEKVELLSEEAGEFDGLDRIKDMDDDEFDWFLNECQEALKDIQGTVEPLVRTISFSGPLFFGTDGGFEWSDHEDE